MIPEKMTKFYCPSCGEESETDEAVIIRPDNELEIRCPNCGDVKIEFWEIEE